MYNALASGDRVLVCKSRLVLDIAITHFDILLLWLVLVLDVKILVPLAVFHLCFPLFFGSLFLLLIELPFLPFARAYRRVVSAWLLLWLTRFFGAFLCEVHLDALLVVLLSSGVFQHGFQFLPICLVQYLGFHVFVSFFVKALEHTLKLVARELHCLLIRMRQPHLLLIVDVSKIFVHQKPLTKLSECKHLRLKVFLQINLSLRINILHVKLFAERYVFLSFFGAQAVLDEEPHRFSLVFPIEILIYLFEHFFLLSHFLSYFLVF